MKKCCHDHLEITTNPQIRTSTNPQIRTSTNPQIHKSTNPHIHPSAHQKIHKSTNPHIRTSTHPLIRTSKNPPIRTSTHPPYFLVNLANPSSDSIISKKDFTKSIIEVFSSWFSSGQFSIKFRSTSFLSSS